MARLEDSVLRRAGERRCSWGAERHEQSVFSADGTVLDVLRLAWHGTRIITGCQ